MSRPDEARPSGPEPRRNLLADCGNCFGLCCVALAFTASADFAMDKEAGEPCRNLQSDFRCGIHRTLRAQGFPGCTVYDCFGAGQQVSQVTFGGRDWREAHEPEQNNTFQDNYREVPFDLSRVLFIATANMVDTIPPALRDRMEIIQLPGYTQLERLRIAQRFLMPKQLENHGLTAEQLEISEEALIRLIQAFTHEAGVRNMERELANIARKVARRVAADAKVRRGRRPEELKKYLCAARMIR